MKYKLKFDIIYPQDKSGLRDAKIDNILSDSETEIVSDSPLIPPHKEDGVTIGSKVYVVVRVMHKIEKDLYTILVSVKDKESIDRKRLEEEREKLRISNSFASINTPFF